MGRLIVSAQMTVDCVMDPIEEWFDATLEEGDGVAQLRAADALIRLFRKWSAGKGVGIPVDWVVSVS